MKDGVGRAQRLLVLGGNSDIGFAIALRMARNGTGEILLAGRDTAALEARAAALRASGAQRVETAHFDADAVGDHEAFLDAAFQRFAGFDVAVIAFGAIGDQAIAERDADAALAVARTNYLGAASMLLRVAERLRRAGQGTVVVLSSVAGQRPRRSNFVYGASKAGIDALAEGLAYALAGQGVQVLVVRPGFVHTKITAGMRPAPFATTPDAVARATVKAIADGRELIWVPGSLRYVMWAVRLLPRAVMRRLSM
jgi:decaprenylphospho-beta-D-erythro-pentofuranosid-2-ulose 2-reductase